MARSDFGEHTNLTTADTHLIRTGPGALVGIIVNSAVATGTITVYDGLDASGVEIATITYPATLLNNHGTFPYFVQLTTGLTVVTSQAFDLTVVWK